MTPWVQWVLVGLALAAMATLAWLFISASVSVSITRGITEAGKVDPNEDGAA